MGKNDYKKTDNIQIEKSPYISIKEKMEKDGDEGNYLSDKRREKRAGMVFFRKSGEM